MNDQELMSFAIARSNDPIIKNPVLRDAMNKDLGPRIKAADGGLIDEALKLIKTILKQENLDPLRKDIKKFLLQNSLKYMEERTLMQPGTAYG